MKKPEAENLMLGLFNKSSVLTFIFSLKNLILVGLNMSTLIARLIARAYSTLQYLTHTLFFVRLPL
jgi:hypothetical protein